MGTQANPIIAQTTPELKLNSGATSRPTRRPQATSLPGCSPAATSSPVAPPASSRSARGAVRPAVSKPGSARRPGRPRSDKPADGAALVLDGATRCPRCHREPADGGSYVCCAGETITWRCTSCQRSMRDSPSPTACAPPAAEPSLLADAQAVASVGHAHWRLATRVRDRARRHGISPARCRGAKEPDLQDLFARLSAMKRSTSPR